VPAASSASTGSPKYGLPITRLALADLIHEWQLSICGVLAVTVVLAPLLLLFGLKYGVVESLRDRLVSDPLNLEIKHFGEDGFDEAWFKQADELPWVGFLVPRTRFSHTSLVLENRGDYDAEPVEVSLIPTGEGDPVLVRAEAPIPSGERVVLSKDAADLLRVGAGGSVEAVITRMRGSEERQTVRLPLEVAAVLPLSASRGAQAFAPFLVLVAVEDYREWQAVPRYGWSGAPPIADPFASFRLYAKTLDDVEPLRRWLRSQHLDVESAADRIAAVKRIDRDLSILLSVLVILAVIGYVLALALNLLAGVARKQRELAVLRLIGFTTRDLVCFPLAQGLIVSGLGSLLAVAVFLAVQPVLDSLFADVLDPDAHLARLEPAHAIVAIAASLGLAALSSTAASWRAARIYPAENLRDV
jgi:putative ABC transport system permease protein